MTAELVTQARFKNQMVLYNSYVETIGLYNVDPRPPKAIKDLTKRADFREIIIQESISEEDFYRAFLGIKHALARSVYRNSSVDRSITPTNIEYLVRIMRKSMDYTIPAKSKNNVQSELAAELGKPDKSAYSAIHKLKKSGYLIQTEDDLIIPNQELQTLRKVTKAHIKAHKALTFNYGLEFIVT